MTTPTQLEKLLTDYLDELNDEMLREFKWYLGLGEINGWGPIQDVELQDASRAETVDRLVQAVGRDSAADMTVDIFCRMKRNDLAEKLIQALIDSQETQQTYEQVSCSGEEKQTDEAWPLGIDQDLSCSVCLHIYTDPVTVQCGHSFCKTCLRQTWEQTNTKSCPICRKNITDTEPQINISLKNVSEAYRERRDAV